MYSCIHDGKVLDFHYKKVSDFEQHFYIGDIFVGRVFKIFNYWTAVGKSGGRMNKVDGFHTRHKASEFLLRLEGYE